MAHLEPGAPAYVFHADTEGVAFRSAFEAAGFRLAQVCIWLKQTMVMGRQDYHWRHEPILYGWKPGASHRWYSDRRQTTVWSFDRPTRSREHPTMKPVDMLAYAMGNSSRRGDLVLDPFGGSGSTLIAAQFCGRRCATVEKDPRYAQVIVRRWENYCRREATLVGDGRAFAEMEKARSARAA